MKLPEGCRDPLTRVSIEAPSQTAASEPRRCGGNCPGEVHQQRRWVSGSFLNCCRRGRPQCRCRWTSKWRCSQSATAQPHQFGKVPGRVRWQDFRKDPGSLTKSSAATYPGCSKGGSSGRQSAAVAPRIQVSRSCSRSLVACSFSSFDGQSALHRQFAVFVHSTRSGTTFLFVRSHPLRRDHLGSHHRAISRIRIRRTRDRGTSSGCDPIHARTRHPRSRADRQRSAREDIASSRRRWWRWWFCTACSA